MNSKSIKVLLVLIFIIVTVSLILDIRSSVSVGTSTSDAAPQGKPLVSNLCFTAGTLITLADGTVKPIDEITVGDSVAGADGVNTVIEVESLLSDTSGLYGINGSERFLHPHHPFMTTQGWKAIDPTRVHTLAPDINVSQLKVGDSMVTGSGEIVLVQSLTKYPPEPGKQLYNFEVNGDFTYIANGYVVYGGPIITK